MVAPLRNPVHIGMLRDGDGARLGCHKAIVGDAVFAKVAETLDCRRTRKPGAFVYGPIWSLKRKITCGTRGRPPCGYQIAAGTIESAVADVLPEPTGMSPIGFSASIFRINLKILGQPRPSHRSRPPAPEQTESLAMPSDERVWLHIHQRIAPLEHSAQGRHHPPCGIFGPSGPDLSLLEECQLFAEKEILSRHCDTGSAEEEHEPTEVGQHLAQGVEEVSKA